MTEKSRNIDLRNVIASTSICVDPSCTGWLVDSLSGKYWIKCLDPRHNIGKEGCIGPQPQATNPADKHGSIVDVPGPVKRKHAR